MNIRTAYLDWGFELQQDGLVDEDLACLRAQILDLVLLELHGLSGAVASDWGDSVFGRMEVVQHISGWGKRAHLRGGGR